MGAKVNWYIKDRAILTYCWDELSPQDIDGISVTATEWINAAPVPLHSIIHMLDVTKYPMNLAHSLRKAPMFKGMSLGWLLIITDDRMARFLVSTVSQLTNFRFRAFASEEAALEFLMDVDPSLPDLAPLDAFLSHD